MLPVRLPCSSQNNNLTAEASDQFNLGVDIGILDNRLTASIDGYVINTSDVLQQYLLAPSQGMTGDFYLKNGAEMRTTGLDLALTSGHLPDTKEVKWMSPFCI